MDEINQAKRRIVQQLQFRITLARYGLYRCEDCYGDDDERTEQAAKKLNHQWHFNRWARKWLYR